MSAQFQALNEMKRLTSPFPENIVLKDWQAQGKKVLGCIGGSVPEEIIYASGMLPFHITGDNEQAKLQEVNAYLPFNSCSYMRTCFQQALDGKYDFLDGVVFSINCDGDRRLCDNWVTYLKNNPYMDVLYTPRKRDQDALQMYLADLNDWRTRLSAFRESRILDTDLRKAILVYNRGRELLQKFYELRKREHPPVTGAESMEVVKAAMRLPREQFNQLLDQLLEEINRSGREILKGTRLMLTGSHLHNSAWIEGIEELDALVVTDELDAGTRYFWGKVDTNLPPLEALARYYMFERPAGVRIWPAGGRFEHIFNMIKQYNVDGVISEIARFCVYPNHDKLKITKDLKQIDIPILELELEYGERVSGQTGVRVEAFLEMIKNRVKK
jgi:benzoyl-CoA reductase/2-hydroxyglutaryl-CoA dehydratase subunit BcrC/BadD/HgdB